MSDTKKTAAAAEAETTEEAVKAVETAEAETAAEEQSIYIGPGFKGVAHGTIYLGGLPAHLQDAIQALPAIGELVIPMSKLVESNKALRDPGSGLAKIYKYVDEKKNGRA